MVSSEPLLKTQQVAKLLGVSGATVKRWVDAGFIKAVRTAGKHRLVPLSEVRRVASELGTNFPVIGGQLDLEPESLRTIDDQVRDKLTALLRSGKAPEARALIRAVSQSNRSGADLADRLIGPVMERIGHGWMMGSLDIYQEHLASSIVAAGLYERIDELTDGQPGPRPVAIGATTEGDFYQLPGLAAELLLRESGWEVRNLGTNLPLRSLASATLEYRPRLIFLSINYLKDEDRFVREYLAFYKTAAELNAAVILGGRALRPELRSHLPYAAFGDRMSHLAEFARRLTPGTTKPAVAPADPGLADRTSQRSSEQHG